MRPRDRSLLWAVLAAVALGFALGWLTRTWTSPTPESRARESLDRMRERARDFAR
jgi:hypothetical protein